MGILVFNGFESGTELETDTTVRGSAEPVNAYARTGHFSIRLPDTSASTRLVKPNDAVHDDDEALDVSTAYFRGYLTVEALPPPPSLPGELFEIVRFGTGTISSNTDWQLRLCLNDEGLLIAADASWNVLGTASYALQLEKAYRVEVKLALISGDDTYEVRVNDESWISGTAALTTHLKVNVIKLVHTDGDDQMSVTWDDCMVRDDDWCGPGRVYGLLPVRAGNYSAWSDSLSYEDVRKAYALSKTTFVSDTAGSNARLSFRVDEPGHVGMRGKIVAVAFHAWVANGGSTTGNLFIRSGGTDHDFFTATIPGTTAGSDTLGRLASVTTVDPTDSNPWTRNKLENLEIGVRNVSAAGSMNWYSAFVLVATEVLD